MLSQNSDLDTETRRAAAIFKGMDLKETRAQTALRFSLANPDLSCVVIGLAELEHLEQAIAAQAKGALANEALRKLEPVYESNFS